MRGTVLLAVLVAGALGCGVKSAEEATRPDPAPAPKAEPKVETGVPPKGGKAQRPKPEPSKKSEYDVPTAGEIEVTQVANSWGLPGQNRAVVKRDYFGRRWNLTTVGNITIETDRLVYETHPHTEWLTVTVRFRDPNDLLTFDNRKSKLNAYCVDAFTFADCVYVK